MTADMEAVERMLRGTANAQNEAKDLPTDRVGGLPGGIDKPVPGSSEEKAMLEAAWADPEFRKAFYAQYGDKLEAMGYKLDGTFPKDGPSMPIGEDGKRGLTIVPEAGFVVKTRTIETNEKVFINFCKSPKVRSFSREPDPNDSNVERVRIPLSLGPARNDLDKGGDPCVVYDVVFNTEVMDQALHSKEFKDFLVGLGMGWVMEKGGGGLDVKQWTTVKLRGNYKGKFPAMQVVRADALIEEVAPEEGGRGGQEHHTWEHAALNPPSRKSAARAAAENSNYADAMGAAGLQKEEMPGYTEAVMGGKEEEELDGGVVVTPAARVYVQTEEGREVLWRGREEWGEGEEGVRAVVVVVEVARVERAGEADVVVVDNLLSLEVPGKYELEIELPMAVDDQAADAVFDKQRRELRLTLPLQAWTARAYAEARRKAADKYGEAQAQETGKREEGPRGEGGEREGTGDAGSESRERAETRAGGEGGKSNDERGGGEAGAKEEGKEEGGGAGKRGGVRGEFGATLQAKLKEKREKQAREEGEGAGYILGSKEEADAKARQASGPQVSNRRPFECERCHWRAVATAIRRCRRCNWCEPGSKEEEEVMKQVKEQEKWHSSRKADEVGAVDETGGIEDEASLRAYRFSCRLAWELDDDVPDWLKGVRQKMYGGGAEEEGKAAPPGDPQPASEP